MPTHDNAGQPTCSNFGTGKQILYIHGAVRTIGMYPLNTVFIVTSQDREGSERGAWNHAVLLIKALQRDLGGDHHPSQ